MGVSSALLGSPGEEAFITVGFVTDEIALVAGRMICRGYFGVSACPTAVTVLPSGQIWPSSAGGACTSGATAGNGGRAGMV